MLKSMRKSKNRYSYHIFVSPGDAPGAITLNVVWMEREFDAYKLSRMYPSVFNSFPVIYLFKHFTVHIEHERKTANECEPIARSGTCHLRPAKS